MKIVFDRGTVLVLDPPPGFRPDDVDGLRWDPRVGCYRAPARRYAAVRSLLALLASGGVPVSDAVRPAGQATDGWQPIELRPYQEAALDAWELSGRCGIVALPTGSGKTRLALAAMARNRQPVLCLVPTRVLLDQWVREIGAVYTGPVGRFGDGVRELQSVTVATFESAYRWMDRIGQRFDLLIVDEAHHFGVGVRDEALEMCVAAARLGLTATPHRENEAATKVTELIGPVVYELHVGDLAGSYLADLDSVTIRVALTQEERVRYEGLMATFRPVRAQFVQRSPDLGWAEFARAAARTPEGRRALMAWREVRGLLAYTDGKRKAVRALLDRHRAARTLVFTADNDTAYTIAREHLIMPFTCDIARRERDEALDRFRRGELRALVSARVLNEGIDVPDADVAVVVGASFGEREHVQRVGRLLRPGEGKRALVYELVSTATGEVAQARRRRAALAARVAP